MASLAGSLGRRLPGPDVPPEQLHDRGWWKSQAEVYVVVDDYDLVASSSGGPLQPLYSLLPQSRDLAFHLVSALQGAILLAHSFHNPRLLTRESNRLKEWVRSL